MESSRAVFLMRQFACEQLPMLRRSLIMVVMWLMRVASSGRFAVSRLFQVGSRLRQVCFVVHGSHASTDAWWLCASRQFQVGSRLSSGLLRCP